MGQWLVRMGESMLKSKPVRKHFTRILRNTLTAQCEIRGAAVSIRVEGGLMFVSGDSDTEIEDALKHTFGVNAVDPFTEVEPTPEDVANMRKEGGIMDELVEMNRTSTDAMGAAHRKVKEHILEEDKRLGYPDCL